MEASSSSGALPFAGLPLARRLLSVKAQLAAAIFGRTHVTNAIEISNMSFAYRDAGQTYLAVENANLSIKRGEFVCLIGHSGCGKTTLLNLIAGLERPTVGGIVANGKPVTGPGADRAMVFQHYSLFPWMTVVKNVAFSIEHSRSGKKLSKDETLCRANTALAQVGMLDSADKYPFQLSGGMQQRVAIARALAMESEILLMDEPFGALDARNRAKLQALLERVWNDGDNERTAVFVTHDLDEAILLADRIVFMRPGHIERAIEVNLPRPRTTGDFTSLAGYHELRDELLNLFYMDED